jgi:RAP domain
LGWKVIHLPFWEWYALGGDAAAEDAYCSELLTASR